MPFCIIKYKEIQPFRNSLLFLDHPVNKHVSISSVVLKLNNNNCLFKHIYWTAQLLAWCC